jgi:hypothetical protein
LNLFLNGLKDFFGVEKIPELYLCLRSTSELAIYTGIGACLCINVIDAKAPAETP